jgi:hypothetical protein
MCPQTNRLITDFQEIYFKITQNSKTDYLIRGSFYLVNFNPEEKPAISYGKTV